LIKKEIKFILNQIRRKSINNKIDPQITNRVWKNMIYSYIDFEKRNFKKKIIIYYVEEVSFPQKFHVCE
jgi:hypothetical protein